eukprot:SAG31_NODE_24_length_33075_cov_3.218523_2_plen_898_part_00
MSEDIEEHRQYRRNGYYGYSTDVIRGVYYKDVSVTVACSGTLEVRFTSGTNQPLWNEGWAFSNFSVQPGGTGELENECEYNPECDILPEFTEILRHPNDSTRDRRPPISGWPTCPDLQVEPVDFTDDTATVEAGCSAVVERCLSPDAPCGEMPPLAMPLEHTPANCMMANGECGGDSHPTCSETGHGPQLSARPRMENGTARVENVTLAINQSPSNYSRMNPSNPSYKLSRIERDAAGTSHNLARSFDPDAWFNSPDPNGTEISLWSMNTTQGHLNIARYQCGNSAIVFCKDGFNFNPFPRTDTHLQKKLSWCIPEVPFKFTNESIYLRPGRCDLPTEWVGIDPESTAASVLGITQGALQIIDSLGKPHQCELPPQTMIQECGAPGGNWQCWDIEQPCTVEQKAVAEAIQQFWIAGPTSFTEQSCTDAGGVYIPEGLPMTEENCVNATAGEVTISLPGILKTIDPAAWFPPIYHPPIEPGIFDGVKYWTDGDPDTCGVIHPIDNPVAIIPLKTNKTNGTYIKTVQIFPVLPPASLYFGELALTVNGFVCEAWSTAMANPGDYGGTSGDGLNPADVDGDDQLVSNFCRNPDGRESAWCFVSQDPNIGFMSAPLWDLCDVHGGTSAATGPGLKVRLAPTIDTFWWEAEECDNVCSGVMTPGGLQLDLDSGCGIFECNTTMPMKYLMVAEKGVSIPLAFCEIAAYELEGIEGYAPIHGSFYYSSGNASEFNPVPTSILPWMEPILKDNWTNYGDGGKNLDIHAGHPLDPVVEQFNSFPEGAAPFDLLSTAILERMSMEGKVKRAAQWTDKRNQRLGSGPREKFQGNLLSDRAAPMTVVFSGNTTVEIRTYCECGLNCQPSKCRINVIEEWKQISAHGVVPSARDLNLREPPPPLKTLLVV